jgi:hypothetical protein
VDPVGVLVALVVVLAIELVGRRRRDRSDDAGPREGGH